MQLLKSGRELANPAEHKWFPVAVLPGQSTFTMNFTTGQFDPEMFAMANRTEYDYIPDSNDPTAPYYAMPKVERADVSASNKVIILAETPIEDSVYIEGLRETEGTPAESETFVENGKSVQYPTFKVDYSQKKVTFPTGVVGTVEIIYEYEKRGIKEAIMTNRESSIGEATAIWPVYGSGDDCSESDIVGYYVVKVFRARITTVPGMDTSYKTAATFTFELTALNDIWGLAA